MTDRQPIPEVRRAAIYVRISQDRTGEQLGVERQEVECRARAVQLGYEVTKLYTDNDISATSSKLRPAFEELLSDLASLPVGERVVLTWATDRFVRRMKDLERAIDLGLTVYAVQAGSIDLSGSQGRMLARMLTSVAQGEGELKADRQRAKARQLAEQGKPWWREHRRPMGYAMDGSLNDTEADLIRQAYTDFLRGSALREIARNWAATGYRLLNGKEPSGADVRRILASPRNAGLRTYQGEIVAEGCWAAIVSEEIWLAADAQLSNPDRRRGVTPGGRVPQNLLSGLAPVTCVHCGSTVKMGDRAVGYQRYACYGKCIAYPKPWLEAVVLLHVIAALPYHRAAAESLAPDAPSTRIRELISARSGLEHRRMELADGFASGALSLAAYSAAEAAVSRRLDEIGGDLDASSAHGATAREIADNWSLSSAEVLRLTMGEQRQLIADVLRGVTLSPRGKGRSPLTMRTVTVTTHAPVPSDYARQLADAVLHIPAQGMDLIELARLADAWRGGVRTVLKSTKARMRDEAWRRDAALSGPEPQP